MHPNLALLLKVADTLGPLCEELVFTGGCVTGLLITDPAAPPARPTFDVDVIAELASLSRYYELGERLRQRGFVESAEDGVICRWRHAVHARLILDVMPSRADVMGFGNRWYEEALSHAQERREAGMTLRHVSAPYFLATKIEAFHDRGRGDFLASHDFEDLLAVLDGRLEIDREMMAATPTLQASLYRHFAEWLGNPAFAAALPGHLEPGRDRLLLARLRTMVGNPA